MRPCDRIVENSRRQRPNTMEKEPPSSRRILAAITSTLILPYIAVSTW